MEKVEDIHNEVMCMVHLIKNKRFARLAADNLINYVKIDFANHLIPVVSSLLSPMRNFDHFKEHDLKITIEVLSQIMKRLIEHLEWLEKIGYYHPEVYKYLDVAGHLPEHSDSDFEDMVPSPQYRHRAMTDYEPPHHGHGIHSGVVVEEPADIEAADTGDYALDPHDRDPHDRDPHDREPDGPDGYEEEKDHLMEVTSGLEAGRLAARPEIDPRKIAMNLNPVDYDDENQEFYRVKSALSLMDMWPHIRLLVEGYVSMLQDRCK